VQQRKYAPAVHAPPDADRPRQMRIAEAQMRIAEAQMRIAEARM
jgi:hypothetical protein